MITAVIREILNARIFERQPPFIGRASIDECEGATLRTQLHQHAGPSQGNIFRNIESLTGALFPPSMGIVR